MKLTDDDVVRHAYAIRRYITGEDIIIGYLDDIIADRQAWKAEAEKLQRYERIVFNDAYNLEAQLKQAVEVLKELRRITPYGMYHEMIDPVLGSLSQGTEE